MKEIVLAWSAGYQATAFLVLLTGLWFLCLPCRWIDLIRQQDYSHFVDLLIGYVGLD